MKFILILLAVVNALNLNQHVEVIPDEISLHTPEVIPRESSYVKEGRKDFGDDILKNNGALYYKDPFAYYGPKVTYDKIYIPEKENFVVILL
jgi:hypothetical protein